jgi:hypothetical protein
MHYFPFIILAEAGDLLQPHVGGDGLHSLSAVLSTTSAIRDILRVFTHIPQAAALYSASDNIKSVGSTQPESQVFPIIKTTVAPNRFPSYHDFWKGLNRLAAKLVIYMVAGGVIGLVAGYIGRAVKSP